MSQLYHQPCPQCGGPMGLKTIAGRNGNRPFASCEAFATTGCRGAIWQVSGMIPQSQVVVYEQHKTMGSQGGVCRQCGISLPHNSRYWHASKGVAICTQCKPEQWMGQGAPRFQPIPQTVPMAPPQQMPLQQTGTVAAEQRAYQSEQRRAQPVPPQAENAARYALADSLRGLVATVVQWECLGVFICPGLSAELDRIRQSLDPVPFERPGQAPGADREA